MSTDSPQHTHATGHSHDHDHRSPHNPAPQATSRVKPARSVLTWSAWLRVLVVLPVVVMLWLAVLWANEGAALW
jgi:hypothetical protein